MATGAGSIVLRTVDMHTAGEPVRIVESGYPELEGATILEKRRDARSRDRATGGAGTHGAIRRQASC